MASGGRPSLRELRVGSVPGRVVFAQSLSVLRTPQCTGPGRLRAPLARVRRLEMRTTTWMPSLLCLLGCGAQPEVAGTTTDSAELSSMAAQLGAGSTHGLIAAGDDEIDVPPSVFGTTTDVV